jgi:putative copper export protein
VQSNLVHIALSGALCLFLAVLSFAPHMALLHIIRTEILLYETQFTHCSTREEQIIARPNETPHAPNIALSGALCLFLAVLSFAPHMALLHILQVLESDSRTAVWHLVVVTPLDLAKQS